LFFKRLGKKKEEEEEEGDKDGQRMTFLYGVLELILS